MGDQPPSDADEEKMCVCVINITIKSQQATSDGHSGPIISELLPQMMVPRKTISMSVINSGCLSHLVFISRP